MIDDELPDDFTTKDVLKSLISIEEFEQHHDDPNIRATVVSTIDKYAICL